MKPKKILYIDRAVFGRKKNFFKKLKKKFKDRKFAGQEGFFKASLFYRFNVTVKEISYLKASIHRINHLYDAVAIDWQVKADGRLADYSDFEFIKKLTIPSVLFCGNAQAGLIPSDRVLDLFSAIFKREHYKDLDRYPVSNVNKKKFHTTMLACKAIPLSQRKLTLSDASHYGRSEYDFLPDKDIFFIGQATHDQRIDIVRAIKKSGINFEGGIYPLSKRTQLKNNHIIHPSTYRDVYCSRMDSGTYFQKMMENKINLCLSGFGEFTFRHQEAWLYNCFTLCESIIDKLKLPVHVSPYRHYVPFDNQDDLLEKIKFYLNAEQERRKIADNARRQFTQDYSLKKHSEYIEKAIFENG